MKRSLFLFCLLIFTFGTTLTAKTKQVVVIPIQKEINSTTWTYTKNGYVLADSLNADLIIIHMNTYGGQVVYADSIRTKILNSKTPTYVFIDNNAASAGALISIACDSIFMRNGATIGAATVVNQGGAAAPDKYQSYMRGTIRATAEAQGKDTAIVRGDTIITWHRDPHIAEAMVDQSIYIQGISDTGKVLTLTTNEAIELGFCDGKAENIQDLLKQANIQDYEITRYQPSTYDNIKGFLTNPVFHGLLIMLILGGIYFELQSPGIGFPLIIAIAASVLYFAPLYIDGLAANWEIMLFVIGIILIAFEIFVIPGFGIAGILGISFSFIGLLLSMVNNINFNFDNVETAPLVTAIATTTLAFLFGTTLSIWLTQKFWGQGVFHRLSLESTQNIGDGYVAVDINNDLVDKKGITATDLRPSGKVNIDGKIYDAVALVGLISKGSQVTVTKQESAQLYVVKCS